MLRPGGFIDQREADLDIAAIDNLAGLTGDIGFADLPAGIANPGHERIANTRRVQIQQFTHGHYFLLVVLAGMRNTGTPHLLSLTTTPPRI